MVTHHNFFFYSSIDGNEFSLEGFHSSRIRNRFYNISTWDIIESKGDSIYSVFRQLKNEVRCVTISFKQFLCIWILFCSLQPKGFSQYKINIWKTWFKTFRIPVNSKQKYGVSLHFEQTISIHSNYIYWDQHKGFSQFKNLKSFVQDQHMRYNWKQRVNQWIPYSRQLKNQTEKFTKNSTMLTL